MEEEKENRTGTFVPAGQNTLTAQQLSAKLLSSVSSLQTYVDPAYANASPHGPNQQIYPEAGLFSNLAFSNFYTSTDESDIDAALKTARHHFIDSSSNQGSGRVNAPPSEDEAPISGLNHLGTYLANMRRQDLSSPEDSAFIQFRQQSQVDLVVVDSCEEYDNGAIFIDNLESAGESSHVGSNLITQRAFLSSDVNTDSGDDCETVVSAVRLEEENEQKQQLVQQMHQPVFESIAMELPASNMHQANRLSHGGKQSSQHRQQQQNQNQQQLSQRVPSDEKSKQSAVSLFRQRLKSIGGVTGAVKQISDQQPPLDRRPSMEEYKSVVARPQSAQRLITKHGTVNNGAVRSPSGDHQNHKIDSGGWLNESTSAMLMGVADLERTILTQGSGSLMQQRPHQNGVWCLGNDSDVGARTNNRHQSGVNTESNHQRRRRELSNALLGRRSRMVKNAVSSHGGGVTLNDSSSQRQQTRQAGSEGVPQRRQVFVLRDDVDEERQVVGIEQPVPSHEESNNYYQLFRQFAGATQGSINMLIQTDLTSLSKSSMAGATTVVAATASNNDRHKLQQHEQETVEASNSSLGIAEPVLAISKIMESQRVSDRRNTYSPYRDKILDSLEKESRSSIIDLHQSTSQRDVESASDSITEPSSQLIQNNNPRNGNRNSSFYNSIDVQNNLYKVVGIQSSKKVRPVMNKQSYNLAHMINQVTVLEQNSSQVKSFGGSIAKTGQKTGSFPKAHDSNKAHHVQPPSSTSAFTFIEANPGCENNQILSESLKQALQKSQVTVAHFKSILSDAGSLSEAKADSAQYNNGNLSLPHTQVPSSQVSPSANSKETPMTKKTAQSVQGTCVKVHKGEYRYSSSPLGKRIDIYETSETEDQEDAALASSKDIHGDGEVKDTMILNNSVKKLTIGLEEEEDEEDVGQQNRMPTLCTFDVRDKKTTFQTSCYVKRDIVGTNFACGSAVEAGIFGQTKTAFVPQSRNAGRETSGMALGLKSTLLQDSLNSVISTQFLNNQSHKKQQQQPKDISEYVQMILRENAELAQKNEELTGKLDDRDKTIAGLKHENQAFKNLVIEQKVQIRQHELGAQGFQNCLDTQSNGGGSYQQSTNGRTSQTSQRQSKQPQVLPAKALNNKATRNRLPLGGGSHAMTQLERAPTQTQLGKNNCYSSLKNFNSVGSGLLATQQTQSQQSLSRSRISLGNNLQEGSMIERNPYSALAQKVLHPQNPHQNLTRNNGKAAALRHATSFDGRQNVKTGTGGLKTQKKRLNFENAGISGYQIATLRIKKQSDSTSQLRLHTSLSNHVRGGEQVRSKKDLRSQKTLLKKHNESDLISSRDQCWSYPTEPAIKNFDPRQHTAIKTKHDASRQTQSQQQLTEIKAQQQQLKQQIAVKDSSDMSNIGLSGGDYSPISHTFFKRPGEVPPSHNSNFVQQQYEDDSTQRSKRMKTKSNIIIQQQRKKIVH